MTRRRVELLYVSTGQDAVLEPGDEVINSEIDTRDRSAYVLVERAGDDD